MKNQKTHSAESAETVTAKLNWLPIMVGIAVFAVITFLYFSPMLMDGKIIQQGDILQGKGAARELNDFRDKNHEEALWTNSMFGGMPAFQLSTLYYGNLTRYIDKVFSLGFPHPSQLVFIAMLGFFLLLLSMGVTPWLSIAGGIAFGLSTFNLILIDAGHNSELGAIGYMPMVIAGVLMVFLQKKYLWGGAVTALAVSLEVKSNHLQIAYYLFFILLALGVTEFIHSLMKKEWNHFFKAVGVLVIAAVFGVLSNLSLLWSTQEYGAETIRGKSELSSNTQSKGGLDEDYAFQWSFGKMESLTMLIPNFYGGASGAALSESSETAKAMQTQGISGEQLGNYLKQMPLYWGDQPFTSGPVYIGAICIFFFVLGMFLLKDRMKWWLFGISALGIMLSWGHNFMFLSDLFFQYFPVYNKFRTVTMIAVIPQFCIPLLAFITVDAILRRKFETEVVIKKLLMTIYIIGGICLFIALLGSSFFDFKGTDDSRYPDWLVKAISLDRASLMRMDAFRSLAFILLSAGALWLYLKNRIKGNLTVTLLVLFVFVDMFTVGRRYLKDDNFVSKSDYDQYFQPTQADMQIMQDKSLDYRVLNLTSNTFNDSRTSYYHKSVGGYHAAKLRRFQELIENHISKQNASVLDMLNTKYFIMSAGKDKQPMARPNPSVLGNAWFVDSAMVVANADEELNRIGNMYEVQTLDGSNFTVNGKTIGKAMIGNHDNVVIADAKFDASDFGFSFGLPDTFGVSTRVNKETGEQEKYVVKADAVSGNAKFVAQFIYTFNPRAYAVVDKRFEDQVKNFKTVTDSSRSIKLLSYQPNNLVYESNSSTDAMVVFSEIYYSNGWDVYVDDKKSDYFRCNYVLRGMKLAGGKHKIEWKFEPVSYYTGEKVAMATSILILILFFGVTGMEVMKMRKNE